MRLKNPLKFSISTKFDSPHVKIIMFNDDKSGYWIMTWLLNLPRADVNDKISMVLQLSVTGNCYLSYL